MDRIELSAKDLNPVVRGANIIFIDGRPRFGPRYNYGYQLVYIFNGTGRATVNGEHVELGPGLLAIYGPGDHHEFMITGEGQAPGLGTIYFSWTAIDESILQIGNRSCSEWRAECWDKADPLVNIEDLPAIPFFLRVPEERRGTVEALITEIGLSFIRRGDELALHHKATLLEVFHQLVEIHREQQAPQHRVIQRFRSYVNRRLSQPLRRGQASCHLGISESYLTALLRRELGCNFTEYVTNLRLNRAMEMVRFSELSINEIAYRVGYRTPSYFIQQFRKRYGASPAKLR